MQLRERASVLGPLVALVAVTATMWFVQPRDRSPHHAVWIDNRGGCADVPAVPAVDRVPVAESLLPVADRLYRQHRFDDAAGVAREAATRDASFVSVAELYIQFAHAWSICTDPSGRAITKFEALREARKLDVVLGGVYASELDVWLARETPSAAVAYTAAERYEEAAVALAVGDALGLDSNEALHAVRAKLHAERIPQ